MRVTPAIHQLLVKSFPIVTLGILLASCSSPKSFAPTGESAPAPLSGQISRQAMTAPALADEGSVKRSAPKPDRLGLGTSLGAEIWDGSYSVPFFRHSDTPNAVASFHYNDEDGAKVMAEMAGKPVQRSGSFRLADGKLEASLVESWGSQTLDWYQAGGRIIVIGKSGASYAMVLKNPTKHRVEVVVSVDGLDVLSGSPASMLLRGYIIAPKSEIRIAGMKTHGKLRRFQFNSVEQSQANKSQGERGARNVGVIGVALFQEDEAAAKLAKQRESLTRGNAQAFPRN